MGQYLWKLQRLEFSCVVFPTHHWSKDFLLLFYSKRTLIGEILSVNFKWHVNSILNNKVATWLHAEPKTAIHEQSAVNIQPYTFCGHTHTLCTIEVSLCPWLASTLKFKKVNGTTGLLILKTYHKFLNTKKQPQNPKISNLWNQ